MTADEGREAVLEICRALSARGFLAGTGGNVAVRADDGLVAVTPSATDYEALSTEDVCLLRLESLEKVDGRTSPSVESGLHARLLRGRPEWGVSVHTHQPLACAYTLLGRPLEVAARRHRTLLGETVPLAGYAPSGTAWLTSRVARAMGAGASTCLMKNHGAVVLASSPDEALRKVEALEQACAAFFEGALAEAGSDVDSDVLARVHEAAHPKEPGSTP